MKIAGVVLAGALLLAGSAVAQDGGKAISSTPILKTAIKFGTATPGGGFPL
jgi:uncharacterized protein